MNKKERTGLPIVTSFPAVFGLKTKKINSMLGHVNTRGKKSEFRTQTLRLHSKGPHHRTDMKLRKKFIDYLDKLFPTPYGI